MFWCCFTNESILASMEFVSEIRIVGSTSSLFLALVLIVVNVIQTKSSNRSSRKSGNDYCRLSRCKTYVKRRLIIHLLDDGRDVGSLYYVPSYIRRSAALRYCRDIITIKNHFFLHFTISQTSVDNGLRMTPSRFHFRNHRSRCWIVIGFFGVLLPFWLQSQRYLFFCIFILLISIAKKKKIDIKIKFSTHSKM